MPRSGIASTSARRCDLRLHRVHASPARMVRRACAPPPALIRPLGCSCAAGRLQAAPWRRGQAAVHTGQGATGAKFNVPHFPSCPAALQERLRRSSYSA